MEIEPYLIIKNSHLLTIKSNPFKFLVFFNIYIYIIYKLVVKSRCCCGIKVATLSFYEYKEIHVHAGARNNLEHLIRSLVQR